MSALVAADVWVWAATPLRVAQSDTKGESGCHGPDVQQDPQLVATYFSSPPTMRRPSSLPVSQSAPVQEALLERPPCPAITPHHARNLAR